MELSKLEKANELLKRIESKEKQVNSLVKNIEEIKKFSYSGSSIALKGQQNFNESYKDIYAPFTKTEAIEFLAVLLSRTKRELAELNFEFRLLQYEKIRIKTRRH